MLLASRPCVTKCEQRIKKGMAKCSLRVRGSTGVVISQDSHALSLLCYTAKTNWLF